MNQENLGPAERIIQSLLTYSDHAYHGRPGIVVPDGRTNVGVRWEPVTHKVENDKKVVYRLQKVGKKTQKVKVGTLQDNKDVTSDAGAVVGKFRDPGLFPEVVAWMYKNIADVWQLDNEFAARWASYAYGQEHRDLKVVLAAFSLVQSRKGDPVIDGGKIAFYDDDFRDVGEAMMLNYDKDSKGLNPKEILRIHDVLTLPEVAKINQEIGFGRSARHAFLGRWTKAVEKWLRYREENPRLLEGLVKAGFRTTVMELARRVGYKPETPKFFETLRWKQVQADDGRRSILIGADVKAAETWQGLTEQQICERIVQTKPNWKVIVSMIPKEIGITRAIMAAAVESNSLSQKDLIIASPTLEDLGLLKVQEIRERWEKAVREAEDMRAAHIATRVKSKETQDKLQEASDNALKKAAEEVTKNIRAYVFVDRSGSMQRAIDEAKRLITKLLPAFPLDRLHIAYFNTIGKEVTLKAASGVAVEQAFRGVTGSGGTDYGSGIRALADHKPKDDEDSLFLFVGDQQAADFDQAVRNSGLRPLAFGFVYTPGSDGTAHKAVENTAAKLQIPCFRIDDKTFEDAYAIPRTVRNLIAATPVGVRNVPVAAPRVTLAQTILNTKLLVKPAWAA